MRIFHTADFHLGMTFTSYPTVQTELSEARYETLERLIERANEENADIFSIAGDLFDSISQVKVSEIERVAKAFDKFEGALVMVLPGNHDYIKDDSTLWNRLKDEVGDRVKIFEHGEDMFDLNHYNFNAHVYPAACEERHKNENNIGWIVEADKSDDIDWHIGIAHGAIEGVSPDFQNNYFKMTRRELEESGIDVWLLGHSHVSYPKKPTSENKIFNPGTPEPDGFDCNHGGRAFLIDLQEERANIEVLKNLGKYRFVREQISLHDKVDLQALENEYANESYKSTLLDLRLEGRLEPKLLDMLNEVTEKIREKVFYLTVDKENIYEAITADRIDEEFPEESFANKLLKSLSDEEEEDSDKSMQIAYDLLKEASDQ